MIEVDAERMRDLELDCILYRAKPHWLEDRHDLLSEAQRALPRIVLEHDPLDEHPTDTRRGVDDPDALLVHGTPFSALPRPDRCTIGDYAGNDAGAVWNGERFRAFRQELASGTPPEVCRSCSLYRGTRSRDFLGRGTTARGFRGSSRCRRPSERRPPMIRTHRRIKSVALGGVEITLWRIPPEANHAFSEYCVQVTGGPLRPARFYRPTLLAADAEFTAALAVVDR